ncbi:MAG: hypothetical protein KGR47_15920, partial [Acidobacteria bacterium]|nr:hypothetical protein [Acidobacteriota bacterium]
PGNTVLSVDGLGGGTINGDVVINGSLTATNGAYPKSPLIQFGRTPYGCSPTPGNLTFYGWNELAVPTDTNPIVLFSIDESLDDNGASWVRGKQIERNRVGVRCDSTTDALHWMTVDSGVFTVSGKKIMTGRANAAQNNQAIFFPEVFPTDPVVLLFIDESVDDNGGGYVRTINTVAKSGFQVYLDGAVDGLYWVAMEQGAYDRGPWKWRAGLINTGNVCSSSCTFTWPTPFTRAPGVITTIHEPNNSGASWIRHRKVTNTSFQYRMNAASEFVQYVAFEEK